MKKLIFLVLVFIFNVIAKGDLKNINDPNSLFKVKITLPSLKEQSSLSNTLITENYDVNIPFNTTNELEIILNKFEFEKLLKNHPNLKKITQIDTDSLFTKSVPRGYRNLAQINEILFEAEKQYPNLASVIDIAKKFGPGKTYEGRPIYALKLTSGNKKGEESDKPSVLILSAHHCREIVTPEIALYAIKKLTEEYGRNQEITRYLNQYQVFIVPILNVDGLDYVWTREALWRKNRKPTGGGIFGIDLNRNYDLDWVKCGGSTDRRSETYKGPSPFSEEETQTISKMATYYNFAKLLDFHSYGREVLHAYHSCTNMDPVLRNYIIDRSRVLAETANYRLRDPSGNGQHQSWNIKTNTAYSFLVETHTTFQPTYESAMTEVVRVWPLILKFLNQNIPLHGHVYDAATRKPLKAFITVDGIRLYANETKNSHEETGRYHVFLPGGTFNINFSAQGYKTSTLRNFVIPSPNSNESKEIDVLLEKLN